jgi:hypothetical protein
MTTTPEQDRIIASIHNDYPDNYTPEFVFLVGLQVRGDTRAEAESNLMHFLPRPTSAEAPSPVECWWIAEDDRNDRSDNDSAVFVDPGAQPLASSLLFALGVAGSCNVVEREGGQFTGAYEPSNASDATRHDKARVIHTLMGTLGIGQGDLDLIDVLDRSIDDGKLDPENEAEAFRALAGQKEYEWHGMQEDLWERLREETEDALQRKAPGLLIDEDEED